MSVGDRVDRPGVHLVGESEVARYPVAEVHEVEELGEPPLTLGLDLDHLVHSLLDYLPGYLEPPRDLRVLEAVPELDQGDQLTGDVAVLSPAADLVVVQLGVRVPERRRLGVLVHVGLPAHRGDRRRSGRRRTPTGSCRRSGERSRAPGWTARRPRGGTDRVGAPAAPEPSPTMRAPRARARSGRGRRRAERPGRPAPRSACIRGGRRREGRPAPRRDRPTRPRSTRPRPARRVPARTPPARAVSSVSPEYDTAKARVRGPTNPGRWYCL